MKCQCKCNCKKTIGILFIVVLVVVVVYALYGFCLRKATPMNVPQNEQVMAILEQNDCFVCHSQDGKMPFYFSFPVMKQQMEQHVLHAQRFVDLKEAMADPKNVDEATLAKIEHAMLNNTMPIIQYKMVHWGTGFNKKERGILAEWIATERAARFATGLNAEALCNEPLQAIPDSVAHCPKCVALGEKMYNDKRISLDGTISCYTCHMLNEGGVSDKAHRTSEGIYGQFGGVNAPTVYNACFNVQQFWNGRAATLQDQAAGPPANPVEMGDQTWDQIVERLRQDKALVKEFEQLFPGEGLTQNTVTRAIAEFEKTLITPNNAFDKYLKGDEKAISEDAKAGYAEFKTLGCASCHVGVIAGGQSFERLSIYGDYFADRDSSIAYGADDDGLKGFTGRECDMQKFKVPGLRNVDLTAPYFHDGSQATLEDAVRAMAKYELNKELDDATVAQLVAFMQSL